MCDSFSIIWLKAVSIIKREGDNDDANPKDTTIAWIGSAPAANDNTIATSTGSSRLIMKFQCKVHKRKHTSLLHVASCISLSRSLSMLLLWLQTLLFCTSWTPYQPCKAVSKALFVDMSSNSRSLDDGGDWVDVVTTKRKSRKSAVCDSLDAKAAQAPQLILVLVGLPGSGKSYFASKLEKESSSRYVRVNQDSLGTRKKCETACRQALSRGKSVIIDRCNFDATQREHWLKFGVPCECIVFNYEKEVCVRRCRERRNHETIDARNAAAVVRGMAKEYRPPLPHSPQYQRHVTIDSFRKSNEIVQSYLDRNSRDY